MASEDIQSVLLILLLLSEVMGASSEIQDLIRRVLAGEVITQEEIDETRKRVKSSVSGWDGAAKKKADEDAEDIS